MAISLVIATIIGLFSQQTYTNVIAETNFMENHFSVALWDLDMSPTLVQAMRDDLPNSNLIIRAKSRGQIDYSFKSYKQYVEILEIYQGEGLNVGEQVAITTPDWRLFFDDMTANLNFINFMQTDEEYLIFLDVEINTLNPKDCNIYLLPGLIIPPIFNYQDKGDTVIKVPENNRYVPYEKVKNNEFFVSSEEALKELTVLKHELLHKYPR